MFGPAIPPPPAQPPPAISGESPVDVVMGIHARRSGVGRTPFPYGDQAGNRYALEQTLATLPQENISELLKTVYSDRASFDPAMHPGFRRNLPEHAAIEREGSKLLDTLLPHQLPGVVMGPPDRRALAYFQHGQNTINIPNNHHQFSDPAALVYHELEHARQGPAGASHQRPDVKASQELPAALANALFSAEAQKRATGHGPDYDVMFPSGVRHNMEWMRRQWEQHGHGSLTELLAKNPQYVIRLVGEQ